jgi:hypothetical protein
MALFTPAMTGDRAGLRDDGSGGEADAVALFRRLRAGAARSAGRCRTGSAAGRWHIAFMGVYLVGERGLHCLRPAIEVLIAARFLQGVGAAAGVAISRADRARPVHPRALGPDHEPDRDDPRRRAGLRAGAGRRDDGAVRLARDLRADGGLLGLVIVLVIAVFVLRRNGDPGTFRRIRPRAMARSYGTAADAAATSCRRAWRSAGTIGALLRAGRGCCPSS